MEKILKTKSRQIILLISGALLLISIIILGASYIYGDRVLATVGDKKIRKSDFSRAYEIAQKRAEVLEDDSIKDKKNVLNELVENEIIELASNENLIDVTKNDIDNKILSVSKDGYGEDATKDSAYGTYENSFGLNDKEFNNLVKIGILKEKLYSDILVNKSGRLIYTRFNSGNGVEEITGLKTEEIEDWAKTKITEFKTKLDSGSSFNDLYNEARGDSKYVYPAMYGDEIELSQNSPLKDQNEISAITETKENKYSDITKTKTYYAIYFIDKEGNGKYKNWDEFINEYTKKYVKYTLFKSLISYNEIDINKIVNSFKIPTADAGCNSCSGCSGGQISGRAYDAYTGWNISGVSISGSSNSSDFCDGSTSSSKIAYCGYKTDSTSSGTGAAPNNNYSIGNEDGNNCKFNCAGGTVVVTASKSGYATKTSSAMTVTNGSNKDYDIAMTATDTRPTVRGDGVDVESENIVTFKSTTFSTQYPTTYNGVAGQVLYRRTDITDTWHNFGKNNIATNTNGSTPNGGNSVNNGVLRDTRISSTVDAVNDYGWRPDVTAGVYARQISVDHPRVTLAYGNYQWYVRGLDKDGDYSSSWAGPYTFTLTVPVVNYSLTMSVNPVGSGTTNPTIGTYSYTSGTNVSIAATANAGYEFVNWSNCSTSTNSTSSVTMSANRTCVANFTVNQPASVSLISPATNTNQYPPVSLSARITDVDDPSVTLAIYYRKSTDGTWTYACNSASGTSPYTRACSTSSNLSPGTYIWGASGESGGVQVNSPQWTFVIPSPTCSLTATPSSIDTGSSSSLSYTVTPTTGTTFSVAGVAGPYPKNVSPTSTITYTGTVTYTNNGSTGTCNATVTVRSLSCTVVPTQGTSPVVVTISPAISGLTNGTLKIYIDVNGVKTPLETINGVTGDIIRSFTKSGLYYFTIENPSFNGGIPKDCNPAAVTVTNPNDNTGGEIAP